MARGAHTTDGGISVQTSSWPFVVLAALTMRVGTALVGTGTVTAGSATAPAGCGTQASESAATRTTAVTQHGRPRATRVRRVSPLNPAGKLRRRYGVPSTARGYCWTTSSLSGRLYRCFKRNLIQDPCWKQRGRRSVICLRRLWSRRVNRLRLTRRLPDNAHYGGRSAPRPCAHTRVLTGLPRASMPDLGTKGRRPWPSV